MGKTMQGGRRPGSGRPRKGEGLRKSVSFCLSPEAVQMVQELRAHGLELNLHIEDCINELYGWYFNVTRPHLWNENDK